jgi:LuxR family transcriptional regulator, maltose regulon positive regulatory protein
VNGCGSSCRPGRIRQCRLEGTLGEIGHDEIAFNRNEVERLLNLQGLDLPNEPVEDVVERTEGWAAGVRLAALALQSGGDHARLHWMTAEYLAAEVLSDLTSGDRDFLVMVSLFDEIPGSMASRSLGARMQTCFSGRCRFATRSCSLHRGDSATTGCTR